MNRNNNESKNEGKKKEVRMEKTMLVNVFEENAIPNYLNTMMAVEDELKRVKKKKLGKEMYPKLTIKISSGGGDVYVANTIISMMEHLKRIGVEVNTECCGYSYSSGILVFMHGMKRTFTDKTFSTLMWHQVSLGTYGKKDNVETYTRFIDKMWDTHEKYLIKNSKLTREILDEKTHRTNEWFIDYREAKKYGIVTD